MRSVQHNTASRLVAHRDARGAQLALVDEDRRLDYRGLDDRIARCAALLAANGIERGERVALVLGNRTAYLETVLAAARLGAIATPLNARLTAPELHALLADATPRVLIHEAGDTTRIDAACRDLANPPAVRIACSGSASGYERGLAGAAPRHAIEPVSPDDPMLLMYTSGTTGTPKGALLPHRKTLYNSLNAEVFFSLTEKDRVLVSLPLFHSFGLKILSVPTLFVGATALVVDRFDPIGLQACVARERATLLGAVPVMYQRMLEAGLEPERLASLRFAFSAGAALGVDTIERYARAGLRIQQGYGQTETSILCCLDARDALRKAGSVGKPVRFGEVRIADERGRDVPRGVRGEVVVRGPIVMSGYWRRPEETEQSRIHGWHRTGDLGVMDEDGDVSLVGRLKELYISGGENVYPAEVERVLGQHPAVSEVAVVGVPDAKWGEAGRAYIVPADRDFDATALLVWASERLARYKLPRDVVVVAELPRTASGKVQKHALLART